jgi:hypothetical protein
MYASLPVSPLFSHVSKMILISIGKLLRCNSLSSTQTDVLISGLDKINLFNPKGFFAAYAAATVPPQELPNKLNFSI